MNRNRKRLRSARRLRWVALGSGVAAGGVAAGVPLTQSPPYFWSVLLPYAVAEWWQALLAVTSILLIGSWRLRRTRPTPVRRIGVGRPGNACPAGYPAPPGRMGAVSGPSPAATAAGREGARRWNWPAITSGISALTTLGALMFTGLPLNATEQEQISDRYTKAIDQIGVQGPDRLQTRLGGIYALERLTRDSLCDQPTIIEVLSAFIRGSLPHAAGWARGPPYVHLLPALPACISKPRSPCSAAATAAWTGREKRVRRARGGQGGLLLHRPCSGVGGARRRSTRRPRGHDFGQRPRVRRC